MNTNNVVGGVSKPTPVELVGLYETFDDGQSKEIRRQFKDGALHTGHVQSLIEHQNAFTVETIDSQIIFWAGLYAVVYGMGAKADLLKLSWPEPDPTFWDVPMVKGLTESRAFNALTTWNKFPVESYYGDLDAAVVENDRHPKDSTYGVRFRAFPEADEDQKNISANQHKVKKSPTKGITLLERQVLEAMYFLKSGGKHLDESTFTHCIGSHFAGGYIPGAHWRGGFCIGSGYLLRDASSRLRTRVAVLTF